MKTGARNILEKSQATKNNNDGLINTGNVTTGIYSLTYLVFDPEAPKGRGIIRVDIPNKKEYRRVKRQIQRKKTLIRFINEYGEPQLVNAGNQNMISCTVEAVELKKDSKVILSGNQKVDFK